MTNYSRTTLRELKKRYLNILKKCLLANLGLILLSVSAMAEPTTYTAEDIYDALTTGKGFSILDQIIETPIQAGNFYLAGSLIRGNSVITFSDGSTFSGAYIRQDDGLSTNGIPSLNFGSAHFDNSALFSIAGQSVTFTGDLLFENTTVGNWSPMFMQSTKTATFEKIEFYNNQSPNGGGALHVASKTNINGEAIFGKYVLDQNGNYTFDENGSLKVLSNKVTNVARIYDGGGAIHVSVSSVTFNKNATFISNEAQGTMSNGGAIFSHAGWSKALFKETALFELNKAIATTGEAKGGAIYNLFTADTVFEKKATFGGYLEDASGDYILDSEGNKISVGNMAIAKETLDAEGNVVASGNAYGGALYVEDYGNAISFSPTHQTSFIANSAISESAEAYGGAIADIAIENQNGKYEGRSIKFQNNSLFQDNIAQGATKAYGGAIYNDKSPYSKISFSDVSFIGNKAESTTTDGEAKGGAIYNSGIMQFNGEALFENNIAQNGGAIYSSGYLDGKELLIFNSNVDFFENEAKTGAAIYSNSVTLFNAGASFIKNKSYNANAVGILGGVLHNKLSTIKFLSKDDIIKFEENVGVAIMNYYGTISFEGGVEFKNNDIGETPGLKTSAIFNNVGSIHFNSIDKSVIFENNDELAIYNNAGTINFNGSFVFRNNKVDINQSAGTINFNHGLDKNGVALVGSFYSKIVNDGIINKTGAGTLILGDEMVNSGAGTFNQTAGLTIAHSEHFLKGTNNILGGELETHGNSINYAANIGDETHTASLIHHSTATGNSAPTSLTTALKIGASSTALFDSATNGIQANYELTEDMAGAGTVTFKDAHLTLGQTNYNGTYVMGENVTLNMQDGDTLDSVSFANLTGSANLKIDADIVNGANGLELVTDKIATNSDATLKLALTDVVLSKKALDNGLSDSYTATVMTGGTLSYGSEKALVATDIYSYEVSGANNQITIDAVKFNEGKDVMKSVAEFDGDAAFNMTIGGDSYEMQSDVVMTKNTKSIVGKDKETSTLTAKKITVNGATLNVENVSVSGENQLIDVASGTLSVTNAKVDNIKNAGTLTANGSEIGALLNEHEATITGGELETVTNKEKGMLSLSAGLRAGTVTNEGELTLDAVTVADLTNSATLKANGSTLTKLVNEQEAEVTGGKVTKVTNKGELTVTGATITELVNEQEAELTASTVEDLTNMGKMTAKDLTLKGALKGTGTATLSGKLVADDIFKSENKIISDDMEVSENVKKMELADLEVKDGTTLDIGTREVTAKEVSVGDKATLQVTLNNLDEHGTMKADKIEAGAGAGVHLVLGEKFEGGVFDVFKGTKGAGDLEVKHNNLYNVIEVEEGKYSFMTKDTEALQESLGATKEEVSVADAMTKGTSTNPAFNKMQSEMLIALQSLETETVAKAKKALTALSGRSTSLYQSQATAGFTQLHNVVSQMLMNTAAPVFGHNGGEEPARASVYIKGLYDRVNSLTGDGFRMRSKGAVLGVQSAVTEDLTVGVGYAGVDTTAKEPLRRTEVKTNTGFVSVQYQPNNWWVSGVVSYSRSQYDEEKHVLSSTGKANYDVDSLGAQITMGYNIKKGKVIVTPEVGVRYLNARQEGYQDSLGTTVEATNSDFVTAMAGFKVGADLGWVRPLAGVMVGYDIITDDISSVNTLANGATYTINGKALDRLSTTVVAGFGMDIGKNATLKLEYNGNYRKEYLDHSGMLRLEVKF